MRRWKRSAGSSTRCGGVPVTRAVVGVVRPRHGSEGSPARCGGVAVTRAVVGVVRPRHGSEGSPTRCGGIHSCELVGLPSDPQWPNHTNHSVYHKRTRVGATPPHLSELLLNSVLCFSGLATTARPLWLGNFSSATVARSLQLGHCDSVTSARPLWLGHYSSATVVRPLH